MDRPGERALILFFACAGAPGGSAASDTGCARVTAWPDLDGDGWGDTLRPAEVCTIPPGYVVTAGDCDDARASVSPDGAETCDGVDEDCDGAIDEDAGEAWYADADGDGHGDPAVVTWSCSEAGVATADDCDDACASCWTDAPEICSDGADNDCDGAAPGCQLSPDARAAEADAKFVGTGEAYAGTRVVVLEGGDLASAAPNEDDGAGAVYVVEGDTSGASPLGEARLRVTAASSGWLGNAGLAALDGPALAFSGSSSLGAAVLVVDTASEGDIDASTAARARLASEGYPVPWGDVAAGDVDADGVEDVVVSGIGEEGYGGVVWLIPGDTAGEVDLGAVDGTVSTGPDLQTYWRLAVPGDLDGDGLDDLVLGAQYEGAVYVALGPLEPTDLDDTWARLDSATGIWGVGKAVAGPGDLDLDGRDDLLLGGPGDVYDATLGAGTAWIVCGVAGGETALEDVTATLHGEGAYEFAGSAVAGAGDADGDGRPDVLVGAPGADTVYLVPGDVTGESALATVVTTRFTSEVEGEWFGAAAAAIEHEDDPPDWIIGGPGYADWSGAAWLFRGVGM